MLRKTLLGAAAGLTLAVAALSPSTASAGGFHLHVGGFGGGYWGPGYYGGSWGPACYFKKVKVWNPYVHAWVWKKKKICY